MGQYQNFGAKNDYHKRKFLEYFYICKCDSTMNIKSNENFSSLYETIQLSCLLLLVLKISFFQNLIDTFMYHGLGSLNFWLDGLKRLVI